MVQGGTRKLLQPSLGGGYWSLGDPKTGDYQGIAFDIYAGLGDAIKGNAVCTPSNVPRTCETVSCVLRRFNALISSVG